LNRILVTGHSGLVGRHLKALLVENNFEVVGFDISDNTGNILNNDEFKSAITGCVGVVHLAAVSRVVWGERDPTKCWQTNAIASEQLLKIAAASKRKPWILMSSSREVYGESSTLPVHEDQVLDPVNVYGRSKAYMEQRTIDARSAGVNTAIVRLANVYGCTEDHVDRVLPAFCRRAVEELPLRVDGLDNLFDFTHISDTVRGIAKLVSLLDAGERNLPPIHLLPGVGTTLYEAAQYAVASACSDSEIVEAPSRNYDVSRFIGDPSRAKELLGWEARIGPKEGIGLLVQAFKEDLLIEEVS